MANKALSRLERVYMADQADFAVGPSFGNGDYVRSIKVDMSNDIATLVRRDKTGSRTATIGVKGRTFGKWSYEGSLAPSGVNGTAPDFEPLMKAIFGANGVAGGGGLQYNFVDDPILTFGMASFRTPSTLNQRIAIGCVVQEATFNVGADIAEFTASGECRNVLESDYYDAATTEEKAGYGAMPTEPGAPVSAGGIIAGFTGDVSIGGSSISRIRTATIKINNGGAVVKDTFGTYLPNDVEGDTRNVTITFNMYEDDSAGQKNIREATNTKTPVDVDITVGTVAGSMVQFLLTNVQLAAYTLDDSARRYSLSVPESRAFGTDITSLDEIVMVIK